MKLRVVTALIVLVILIIAVIYSSDAAAQRPATTTGDEPRGFTSGVYPLPWSLPGRVTGEVERVSRNIPGFRDETTVHVSFTVSNRSDEHIDFERGDLSLDWREANRAPNRGYRVDAVRGPRRIEPGSTATIHAYPWVYYPLR